MYNKEKYNLFLEELYKYQDLKYQKFHQKLLNSNIQVIGIKTPILRKIAKEISKQDYLSFIKYNTHKTYEETTIHGLILGYIKIDEKTLLKLIDDFLLFNNNWATNDVCASNLKIFKKINIKKIYKYLNSNNPWTIRFGLTLLLDHYISDQNIDEILNITNNIKNDNYYVKMANAWLISICFIKQRNKTLHFLKNNNLDTFTQNKAISKINDSYRVKKEDKDYLKTLKK